MKSCAAALEPGLPLRQDEIATRYGVSKISVREALLQLVAEGLVASQPDRGFTVSGLQPQEAEKILEICAILECQAIQARFTVSARAPRTKVPALVHFARSEK